MCSSTSIGWGLPAVGCLGSARRGAASSVYPRGYELSATRAIRPRLGSIWHHIRSSGYLVKGYPERVRALTDVYPSPFLLSSFSFLFFYFIFFFLFFCFFFFFFSFPWAGWSSLGFLLFLNL